MLLPRQIKSKIKDYKRVIKIEKEKGNEKEVKEFTARIENLEKQLTKQTGSKNK